MSIRAHLPLALVVVLALGAQQAHAQATRTWVSGVGSDSAPCSRTEPCQTFAAAIGKTARDGEINCLDPGGFGAVTVTKSITIDCTGVSGGVLASGTSGVIVNVTDVMDTTKSVRLRGLRLNGAGTGTAGVVIIAATSVVIEDSAIIGFRAANGVGVDVRPNAGIVRVLVQDTSIEHNLIGVRVAPTGSAGPVVVLDRVTIAQNGSGVFADGRSTSAFVSATIRDSSVVFNSGDAVTAISAATATHVTLDRSAVIYNQGTGALASGAAALVLVAGSAITSNNIGMNALNSGSVQSFKDNRVLDNGTNGTPLPQATFE